MSNPNENQELQTLCSIRRAKEMIVANLNETKAKYRERLRGLEDCERKIYDNLDDPTENLFPVEELLSPEIQSYLENPLQGL